MTERDFSKENKNAVFFRASAFCAETDAPKCGNGPHAARCASHAPNAQTGFLKRLRHLPRKRLPQKQLQNTFRPQAGCSGLTGSAFRVQDKNSTFTLPMDPSKQARRLRRELAVLAGLLLALFLSNFTGFASACAEVRADTLRLHILANSDSEADQALKLTVRDAILAEAGGLFASGQTKQDALDAARQSLPMLQAIAEETLRAHGCSDAVSVRLEELYFDTREYEDFTLPAGRYDAVRIEIGAHEGKNWFCVLFPPLCLPAASGGDASGTDTSGRDTSGWDTSNENAPAYSEAEQNAIHSPYRLRFAAVELFEGWREALRQSSASSGTAASQSNAHESGAAAPQSGAPGSGAAAPQSSAPGSGAAAPQSSAPEGGTAASGKSFEK